VAHNNPQPFSWDQWQALEEQRKAHLNGAANSNIPGMNPPTPVVWGGWGQQKPRVRMPPALTRMGFPFVPPKPPPPTEDERRAIEFRKTVAGIDFNGNTH
jgi:hypothetical protein